jgi:hypothetical protein
MTLCGPSRLLRFVLAGMLLLGHTVLPWIHLEVNHGHPAAETDCHHVAAADEDSHHAAADCCVCDLIHVGRTHLPLIAAVPDLAASPIAVVAATHSNDPGCLIRGPVSSRAPPFVV